MTLPSPVGTGPEPHSNPDEPETTRSQTSHQRVTDSASRLLHWRSDWKPKRAGDLEEDQTAGEVLEKILSRKLPPEEVKTADKTIGDLHHTFQQLSQSPGTTSF